MRRLDVNRLLVILLFFFFIVGNIFVFTSQTAKAGVKASPAKLVITMPDGYPDEKIQYKIKVTNPYSENMTVISTIINPFKLASNYSNIPELSWIKISPEQLHVPPNSYGEVEVEIVIPEGEKNKQYNKQWEAWAYLTPKVGGPDSTVSFQTQLAVRLFIHTPVGEDSSKSMSSSPNFLILFGIIFGSLFLFILFKYLNNKKKSKYEPDTMFYVKENKDHKNK